MSGISEKIKNHKTAVIVLAILVLGGGYYYYKYVNVAPVATHYVLAKAEKGMLVVSVSGTGQVSASDQVDVKSQVSGDLTKVNIIQGQTVKKDAILAQVDSRDAVAAVNNAQVSLDSERKKLSDLIAPLDAQTLLQDQNAVVQAQSDLAKAQTANDNISADTEKTLATAYDNGYSQVSSTLFSLSNYMTDLKGVRGTSQSEQEYMTSYSLILGDNSLFVKKFNDDFNSANDLYTKNAASFVGVFRNSDRTTVYNTINNTLETTKAISQALESARHMYDAITNQGYSGYTIAATINKMQPIVQSDLSVIFSNISTLQSTVDTIDTTVKNAPTSISDAALALKSAQENLSAKQKALDDFKQGVNSVDINAEKNVVAQKESALADAKAALSNYFIRSPFDGVVAKVNNKSGDTISSGTAIATIITNQQIVGITLNEVDIVKVKMGQKATITFDAIDGFTATGLVSEIDSIGTVTQGVVSYGVKISLDTEDVRIKPGMSASVAIITDAKQDVVIVPNAAIKQQGGTVYVQIADGTIPSSSGSSGVVLASAPRNQTVVTGMANDTMTEIVSGLNEGDNVVTRTITGTATTAAPASSSSIRIPGLTTGGATGGGGGGFRGGN